MTVGLSATRANAYLDTYRSGASNVTAGAVYVQLHTADPGAAGTTAVSAVTTRNSPTFNAASSGSMTLSSLGSYSMTSSETISHISIWTASSGGTFLQSAALTSSVPVINGSTISFSSLTLSFTPLAA